MRKIVPLLVLLIAIAGCKRSETAVPSRTSAPATATGTEVGFALPEYTAMKLDGSTFDLASTRKKVVLLNIWATWCGPCRYEIPELQRIHDQYAARGFEVIGVSVDESGVESVKQFVAEHKMTYPQVLDAEGKLATILETSMLPTSVMLDRTGKIVWKKIGAIEANDKELTSILEKTL
jgi:thiol-disulfide isomerase/thioredoxin